MKRVFYLMRIVLLFLIYFVTAEIGLRLDAVSGFAALFWLPTGISLVALLIFGFKLFPGIFAGAFLANYVNDAPFVVACGIAIGNTLEAITGAYLLKKVVDFQKTLTRVRDVLGLIFCAAVGSTVISATIGVSSLFANGILSTPYLATWISWWVGDAISNLITAPFLLVWSILPLGEFKRRRIYEGIVFGGSILLVGLFLFSGVFGFQIRQSAFSYMVFPPLIWAALRFGQREVVTSTFVLSVLAVLGTVRGHGPFVGEDVQASLLQLQSFMAVVAVTSMILAAAVSERRALEKKKDEFFTFASHELKTPLTSIKGYTQILEKMSVANGDKQTTLYLRKMQQPLGVLVTLINNMLDVTKMHSGTIEVKRGRFLLNELIAEIIDASHVSSNHTIQQKGNGALYIHADKDQISQVLTNLLSNAVKYSPEKKVITVRTQKTRDKVIISIKDYGMGIPKEHQERVFDRFYRIQQNGMSTKSGLGIGLYLSKMIVTQHGGEIWITSANGKGTTFSFSLPLESSITTA